MATKGHEIDFKVDRRLRGARLYRGSDGSIEVRTPSSLSKRLKTSIVSQIESGKIVLPPLPLAVPYPESLHIPLLNKTYRVTYHIVKQNQSRFTIDAFEIRIMGESFLDVDQILGSALKKLARGPLSNLLDKLLETNGQELHKIRVGLPNGRWASRSSSGTISLSARLLLLNKSLIEGVMLHEIAHISHMNHSRSFYKHLEELDPSYLERRRGIKHAEENFPPWVRNLK